MIVFDVVHVVGPEGAKGTSYPQGRWLETTRATREAAEEVAELYNDCRTVEGHEYVVEEIDELSEHRALPFDRKEQENRARGYSMPGDSFRKGAGGHDKVSDGAGGGDF